MNLLTLHTGCSLQKLREIPDETVQVCVSSPPYYGLRDYGLPPSVFGGKRDCKHDFEESRTYTETPAAKCSSDAFSTGGPENAARLKEGRWRTSGTCAHCGAWRGQLGLEESPALFVEHLGEIFAEVNRVLKSDGTLWLNLGDSYMPENRGENAKMRKAHEFHHMQQGHMHADLPTRKEQIVAMKNMGIKRKDLIGIPWRVAFHLQAAGWWLRSDIIWSKPNPMPESVTDRPTKAHEYLFLMAKSEHYFYDAKVIEEPQVEYERNRRLREQANGLDTMYDLRRDQPHGQNAPGKAGVARSAKARQVLAIKGTRNKRTVWPCMEDEFLQFLKWKAEQRAQKPDVWKVPSSPFKDAHFATFPPDLIKPCILAGSRPGDVVLDPFGGSGTTGMVALELGRKAVLIELNPAYCDLIRQRCSTTTGLGI